MFIILSLIVAVAAFNLVSTLVMAVTDKQADIAILRTLGARPLSIMAFLSCRARLVGFIGLGLGHCRRGRAGAQYRCGRALHRKRHAGACISSRKRFITFPICHPIAMGRRLGRYRIAFVLALLATIYPSWRASRVNPAEALRYE
jgi:lipoprotein-releasing system permease protein